jgi:hypothetical protein
MLATPKTGGVNNMAMQAGVVTAQMISPISLAPDTTPGEGVVGDGSTDGGSVGGGSSSSSFAWWIILVIAVGGTLVLAGVGFLLWMRHVRARPRKQPLRVHSSGAPGVPPRTAVSTPHMINMPQSEEIQLSLINRSMGTTSAAPPSPKATVTAR